MWQRKQTIFLLCSLAAVVVCLLMPVGGIEPKTLGPETLLTNLGWTGNEPQGFRGWPLYVLMVLTGIVSIVTIFLYKKRKLQMKLATWGIVFDLAWYIYYALIYFDLSADLQMHIKFAACMPLVSCVFLWLAKRGVKADDDLVRSMDRIR